MNICMIRRHKSHHYWITTTDHVEVESWHRIEPQYSHKLLIVSEQNGHQAQEHGPHFLIVELVCPHSTVWPTQTKRGVVTKHQVPAMEVWLKDAGERILQGRDDVIGIERKFDVVRNEDTPLVQVDLDDLQLTKKSIYIYIYNNIQHNII